MASIALSTDLLLRQVTHCHPPPPLVKEFIPAVFLAPLAWPGQLDIALT
jgi:hypothetical protein